LNKEELGNGEYHVLKTIEEFTKYADEGSLNGNHSLTKVLTNSNNTLLKSLLLKQKPPAVTIKLVKSETLPILRLPPVTQIERKDTHLPPLQLKRKKYRLNNTGAKKYHDVAYQVPVMQP